MSQSVLFLLASLVGAHRVQVQDVIASTSAVNLGASCDDLQTMFHNRVAAFQASLDEHQNLDDLGRAAQTRFLMRTYGIVRTLRRARTCAWVVDNDRDDLDQARGIVQSLLAGNPCADVARSELEAGASAETQEVEIRAVHRAISVLLSDTCEAAEMSAQSVELSDEAAVEAQLNNVQDEAQDAIEEFATGSHGAFIQTDSGTLGGFMRAIGVAFIMLVLLLACVNVVTVIGAMVLSMIYSVVFNIGGANGFYQMIEALIYSMAISGIIGIGACSYGVYEYMLGTP